MMKERRRPGLDRARRLVGLLGISLLWPVLCAEVALGAVVTVGVVNVNTASAQELELLPGVGPARARAILSARKKRGHFKRIEDLAEIKGVGDSMLDKLRPHVVLTGMTTARQERRPPAAAPAKGGGG